MCLRDEHEESDLCDTAMRRRSVRAFLSLGPYPLVSTETKGRETEIVRAMVLWLGYKFGRNKYALSLEHQEYKIRKL